MASVYTINKGINKPIVFKGLVAQYIWYLGGGLVCLLLFYAIMYVCGLNNYIALGIILVLGTCLTAYVYQLSHKYGEYGLMKKMAKKNIPRSVKSYSRKEYLQLKK